MSENSNLVSDFDFSEEPEVKRTMHDFNRAREFLRQRKLAYLQVFDGPAGFTVLQDLAWFCRANRSTFDPNAIVAAGLNGQREVWLRIQQHRNLSDDQLAAIFRAGQRS